MNWPAMNQITTAISNYITWIIIAVHIPLCMNWNLDWFITMWAIHFSFSGLKDGQTEVQPSSLVSLYQSLKTVSEVPHE
jgi:hypothetical protein